MKIKKNRKELIDKKELKEFMEKLEKDPSIIYLMERNQRKYGTLTEEDLRTRFTI